MERRGSRSKACILSRCSAGSDRVCLAGGLKNQKNAHPGREAWSCQHYRHVLTSSRAQNPSAAHDGVRRRTDGIQRSLCPTLLGSVSPDWERAPKGADGGLELHRKITGRIFAGTPIAVQPAGTSLMTNELAATVASSPMVTAPIILALQPT